ncbi:hypothetical protein HYN69_05985 [Gemmobacter aquarius]|uniref:histidine kinase n=1 Tax=Paragemmobacter aquarius TaxID=2169400 RepID=A0A2S0UJY5_9RHOB|nr:HWE histidine kinase domain-containing protein [Gemmobacter aquarius]AWB48127.1 hypothetical protein HYN69_05985 [Gemmobacter aquarius]
METPQHRLRNLELQRQALADFGLYAFRSEDLDKTLRLASERVSVAMGVPLVKVLEHLPDRGAMLFRSGVNWQPGTVGVATIPDAERSPGGFALRSDRPVVSPDIRTEHRFEMPEILVRHGVRSMVNVIIVGPDRPFGVLEVDATEPRNFSPDDVAFLQSYANLLAAAIERLKIHAQLRQSAQEQTVLARELGHRARNLLGLIRALASQTSVTGRSATEFRDAFIGRLRALSVAESAVFETSGEHVDLGTMVRDILAPFDVQGGDRISLEGAPVPLAARQARMFGLALHELATNAVKYGALGQPTGQVRVDWSTHRSATRCDIRVVWHETGGPQVAPPDRQGFGSRLLQEVVANELQGEATLAFNPGGVHYSLTFPCCDQGEISVDS